MTRQQSAPTPGKGSTLDASDVGSADARPTSTTADASTPSSREGPPEHQQHQRPRAPKSAYHTIIALSLARQALGPIDPRHVEAYMRVAYGTLDHLDADTFDIEVALSAAAVNVAPADAEALAQSYGL